MAGWAEEFFLRIYESLSSFFLFYFYFIFPASIPDRSALLHHFQSVNFRRMQKSILFFLRPILMLIYVNNLTLQHLVLQFFFLQCPWAILASHPAVVSYWSFSVIRHGFFSSLKWPIFQLFSIAAHSSESANVSRRYPCSTYSFSINVNKCNLTLLFREW